MDAAELTPPGRIRIGAAVLVGLLHLAAIAILIRSLAPDFPEQDVRSVISVVTVEIAEPSPTPTPTPPPEPSPSPAPAKAAAAQGAEGEAGKKATPREVAAPRPKIAIATDTAPPVASTGSADTSGALDAGEGTGAGQSGSGTGAGGSGSGLGGGGGAATRPVKIAGDINSARDYPAATRELRIGGSVTLALTVGTDGRVQGCRIVRASQDAAADRITCKLATERFRFRPAQDAAGRPVEAVYGWRQRWFRPN